MRTFQLFRSVLALATLLMVVSCGMGVLVPSTAKLYLKVSPEGGKTILPTLTINHYSLKLTSDSGAVVTRDGLNGVTSMDVTPGNWTLQVIGFNSANAVVATGTKTVTFVEGTNAVTLTLIAATSKVASGTISLDIAWTSAVISPLVQITIKQWPFVAQTKLARGTNAYLYDVFSIFPDSPDVGTLTTPGDHFLSQWNYNIDIARRQATIVMAIKSGTYEMDIWTGSEQTSQIVQVVDGATSFKKIRDPGLMYGIAHATPLVYNPAAFIGSLTGQALGAQGQATYYHFHINAPGYYSIKAMMSSLGISKPVGYLYDSDGVFVEQGDGALYGTGVDGYPYSWESYPLLNAGDYYLRMTNSFIYGGTGITFDLSLMGDNGE